MFVFLEEPKAQRARSYCNYLKCVWIILFFDWVWLPPFLELDN
uniref:ORF42d n=1 Tax=Pinus koraiensis TaxID=88728 RepID=Q85WX7_PINKO|nr:ORF42d [Pinus koraiensis]